MGLSVCVWGGGGVEGRKESVLGREGKERCKGHCAGREGRREGGRREKKVQENERVEGENRRHGPEDSEGGITIIVDWCPPTRPPHRD